MRDQIAWYSMSYANGFLMHVLSMYGSGDGSSPVVTILDPVILI
jgi:hypothetical protein